MRYEPVILDLEGTLIDGRRDLVLAACRTAAELGLPPVDEREIESALGAGIGRLLAELERRAGVSGSMRARALFESSYLDRAAAASSVYPGGIELLSSLPRAHVGVVTSSPRAICEVQTRALGVDRLIGVLVAAEDAARAKPAPDPVLLACQRLGLPATTGIMIGDSASDIEAGRQAGMTTCGVLWGYDGGRSVGAAGPSHTCSTIHELRELLLGPRDCLDASEAVGSRSGLAYEGSC